MLSFLRDAMSNLVTASQKKESDSMSEALAAMDALEISQLLVAMGSVRHGFAREGVDLLDPWSVIAEESLAVRKMATAVLSMKRTKQFAKANAMAVWLFTLRGAENPHLRGSARELWKQLARGYSLIEVSAMQFPDGEARQQFLDLTATPKGFVDLDIVRK